MTAQSVSVWKNMRYDIPASVVVLLVALPLCLGIALASGAPLFSGLISGVVGGVVVGFLSKSPLSISGPAAGLTTIVFSAIQTLPSYQAFLLAVCLAGAIQILLGFLRAGVVGDFIPSAVIKGMLAAIGLILILKQLPHAVGYNASYEGDDAFKEAAGGNTFTSLLDIVQDHIMWGSTLVALVSLIFLFWWDKVQARAVGALRYVPGPLVVVVFGIAANAAFQAWFPSLAIDEAHLVGVPLTASFEEFKAHFTLPDFSLITNHQIWITALTIALVASVETLLSIEAIDKLDPFKRVTPTSRELMAQGVGNLTSGMLGGLPVTSVIVRSSANAMAGGRTKLSAITHGLLLLFCILAIPSLLNKIPLSALAAILIAVGYKLTKPSIFLKKYEKGWSQFIPFVVTITAILLTDLLIGILIGVSVGIIFILIQNYASAIQFVSDGNNYLLRSKKDLFFMHKAELKKKLARIPNGASVIIDLRRLSFIDLDNIEIINDFVASAPHRDITMVIRKNNDIKDIQLIQESL